MTVGELARLYNREFGIGADLTVIPAEGWRRDVWFDATGLPWVAPSPNIPRLESAVHYPGTVFYEGTNLSSGRGSDHPFEQVGAPWLRSGEVARTMNAMRLPGVRFEEVDFTPHAPGDGKYADTLVHGVRLVATDRATYRPVAASLLLLETIRRTHPGDFRWLPSHFDRLAGTDRMRKAVDAGTVRGLLREWDADAERFRRTRQPYLLYP